MKIGKIIKHKRIAAGLTQAALAKKSGLDFTTISKMEKGSLTGTMNSHRKIASALGISLLDLYREMDETSATATQVTKLKAEKSDTFYYDKKAISQILLSKIATHKMVPEITRLEKGGVTHLEQKPKGAEQFIFVLDGKVEIKAGETNYSLKKGESIYFDASLPHVLKNIGSATARCLRVSSPASL